MHVYIDESGIFPKPSKKPEVVSALAALCVPGTRLKSLFQKFGRLKAAWGAANSEVKGSTLNESQIRNALILLSKHDARAKLLIYDSGLHTEGDILANQEHQVRTLSERLAPSASASLRSEIQSIQARIGKLSIPLFVQFKLLTELVGLAFEEFTLWHAMRDGRELEHFTWAIDPKDTRRTEYEKLWGELVAPFLSTRSIASPLPIVDGGDYRYLDRFREPTGDHKGELSIKRMLTEDLHYPPSENDLGIQLADIVCTSFRRCLAGTLQPAGWERLSKLLILRKASPGTIPIVTLAANETVKPVQRSYNEKLAWLHSNASNMVPPGVDPGPH